MIVYIVEVVFIGEANGGWPDIYKIQEFMHPAIGMLILLPFGLVVNWFVAGLINEKRDKKQKWNSLIISVDSFFIRKIKILLQKNIREISFLRIYITKTLLNITYVKKI